MHRAFSTHFHQLVAIAAISLATTAIAHAGLFLDPADGVTLLSNAVGDADKDDGIAWGTRPMSGSYFGQNFEGYTPTISINGHVNFVGDGDYFNRPLGVTEINRIAPLWQDFRLGESGEIIESSGAGYYGITWSNVENVNHEGFLATFQAVFFETAVTLNGFDFLTGDIVFSYGDFTADFIGDEPTIGLENELGALGGIAPLPGTEDTDGVFYEIYGDLLPRGTGEFVLFRPDGYGYDVSMQAAAIPEPSTFAGLAGVLALATATLRRRGR